jgi:hypothetical protein
MTVSASSTSAKIDAKASKSVQVESTNSHNSKAAKIVHLLTMKATTVSDVPAIAAKASDFR